MGTIAVEATAHTAASSSALWDTVADARTWPSWSIQDEASLEREGSPSADGLGAIRNFRTGRVKVREEVVRFDAPNHFGYKLLSGLPVRDYVGHIDLDDDATGTKITWGATFRPAVPGLGWLLRRKLHEVMVTSATRLAARGDEIAAGASG